MSVRSQKTMNRSLRSRRSSTSPYPDRQNERKLTLRSRSSKSPDPDKQNETKVKVSSRSRSSASPDRARQKEKKKRDSRSHQKRVASKKKATSSSAKLKQQPLQKEAPPVPKQLSMLADSKITYNGGQPLGELNHIYIKLFEMSEEDDIKVQLLDCEHETYYDLQYELDDGGVRVFYRINSPGVYEILIKINHRSEISIFDVPYEDPVF